MSATPGLIPSGLLTIDYQQTVLACDEVLVELVEMVLLQVAVFGTNDSDVLDSSLAIDTEALSNL